MYLTYKMLCKLIIIFNIITKGHFMEPPQKRFVTEEELEKFKEELISQLLIPDIVHNLRRTNHTLDNDVVLIKKNLNDIKEKIRLIETVALKNQSYIKKITSLLEIISNKIDEISSKGAFIDKLNLLFDGQNKIIKLLEEMQQDNMIIRKIAENNEEMDDWRWSKN